MDEIHTGCDATVTAPALQGSTHVFAGKTGRVTCVNRSVGMAQVLFPGISQSVEIPIEYLTRAHACDDDDLTGLISQVANLATLADAGWKNPSKLESYPEYLKLVTQRAKLTTMQT